MRAMARSRAGPSHWPSGCSGGASLADQAGDIGDHGVAVDGLGNDADLHVDDQQRGARESPTLMGWLSGALTHAVLDELDCTSSTTWRAVLDQGVTRRWSHGWAGMVLLASLGCVTLTCEGARREQSLPQTGGAAPALDDAVWVMAAFVRVTASPDWTHLTTDDEVIRADVALLQTAGALVRDAEGWRVGPTLRARFPHASDDQVIGQIRAGWLQAAAHAGGAGPGWSTSDTDLIRAQGRASAMVPGVLDTMVIDKLDGTRAALDSGGWFLDVGVGSAALALALADRFPLVQLVGIDVYEPALLVAEQDVLAAGRQDRITLERCSVADLSARSRFDLAWLPQPFVPRRELLAGLSRLWAALRPGAWLVMPIADPQAAGDTAFEQRIAQLHAELVGGGTMSVEAARQALADAQFSEISRHDLPVGTLMTARRPQD